MASVGVSVMHLHEQRKSVFDKLAPFFLCAKYVPNTEHESKRHACSRLAVSCCHFRLSSLRATDVCLKLGLLRCC